MYLGMLFSSGLGATTTICHSLKSGDHVVSMDDVYGGICLKDVARTSILTLHVVFIIHIAFHLTGTNRYFRRVAVNLGIQTTFVDMTDLSQLKQAIRPETKVTLITLFVYNVKLSAALDACFTRDFLIL
jgi:cystathionine gamma-lyase